MNGVSLMDTFRPVTNVGPAIPLPHRDPGLLVVLLLRNM